MIKKIPFFLFLFFTIPFYSQITFEKGYYIDNNNNKISCLIKNLDWANNPTELLYKIEEQGSLKSIFIEDIKEFGIDNESKYERFNVEIDRSSEEIREMKYENYPIFKNEMLLLKVLVEGKATLYEYNSANLTRFFFKTDSSPISQLIYKSYKISETQIGKNNQFRQQLWNALKCDNMFIEEAENLSYKQDDLFNFFIKFNKCSNSEFIDFKNKRKKDLFNLNIRPGITNSSLSIANQSSYNFDNKTGFRLGLEAEFVLSFNKNKWAIIVEPTYHNFKTEMTQNGLTSKIDYKTVEFPLGLRYYMFLNNNSKFFANAQYVIAHVVNSTAYFGDNKYKNNEMEIVPNSSLYMGLGYKYQNKYSAEFRMNFKKNILESYFFETSTYRSFSLVFGYTIF